MYKGAVVASLGERHVTFDLREDGVVLAHADIVARVPFGTALA